MRSGLAQSRKVRSLSKVRKNAKPIVELLEDRCLLTVPLPTCTVGLSMYSNCLIVGNTTDSGPGSLRDAIDSANLSVGADTIVFDIPTSDGGFNGSNPVGSQWWTIQPVTALPALTDDGTQILGSTQTVNRGNTNSGFVGTGGTVGIDGCNSLGVVTPGGTFPCPLPLYALPEIAINGAGATAGITIDGTMATGITVEGLTIYNASDGILVTGSGSSVAASIGEIKSVVIGTLPDGTNPGALNNKSYGIEVQSPGKLTVRSSFIGYNGRSGILGQNNFSELTIEFNEVFTNGSGNSDFDGIDMDGINSVVRFNLSRNNVNVVSSDCPTSPFPTCGAGNGIELGSRSNSVSGIATNNLVENNTVTGNQQAGIMIRKGSTGNTISKNVVTGNMQAGISVRAEPEDALTLRQTNQNTISQNSTFANAGLGIDLNGSQPAAYAAGTAVAFDGVTLNDAGDGDAGSNDLMNFPVIDGANILGSNLVVTGFVEPGAVVEFFLAAVDPSGFGEGKTFLASGTEGVPGVDLDASTGSYGPNAPSGGPCVVVGCAGTITTNRFRFMFPLSSLPTISNGNPITATATRTGSTSEFGPKLDAVVPSAEPARIRGRKFLDLNQNGNDNSGADPGLQGATIRAYRDVDANGVLSSAEFAAGPAASATTALPTGAYSLTVNAGNYIVCEVRPPGSTQTAPTGNTKCAAGTGLGAAGYAVSVSGGQTVTARDFGNFGDFPVCGASSAGSHGGSSAGSHGSSSAGSHSGSNSSSSHGTGSHSNGSSSNDRVCMQDASVAGFVYEDKNNNSVRDRRDKGIDDVRIRLTGVDYLGRAVTIETESDDDDGYRFDGLRPGTYKVTERQPKNYPDSADQLGTVNGTPRGTLGNDMFSNIALNAGEHGVNYNFGERPRVKKLVADDSSALDLDGPGLADGLYSGVLHVSVQDAEGRMDAEQFARIQDAVAAINAGLADRGVSIELVDANSPAELVLRVATTSPCGSALEGVLGCETDFGEITILDGANWYTGSDASSVGADQYDFQTIVTHELGHATGLGHSAELDSVMYPSLATGAARRSLTAGDLSIIAAHESGGPEALMASPRDSQASHDLASHDPVQILDPDLFLLTEIIAPPGQRSHAGVDDVLVGGGGDDVLTGLNGGDVAVGGFAGYFMARVSSVESLIAGRADNWDELFSVAVKEVKDAEHTDDDAMLVPTLADQLGDLMAAESYDD